MNDKDLMVPDHGADAIAEFRPTNAPAGAAPASDALSAKLRSLLSSQIMVVVLVLVVSVASLLFMRRKGMDSGISFQSVKIDYQPDNAGASTSAEHSRILRELAASSAPIAIEASQLRKNPFTLDDGPAVPSTNPVTSRAPDTGAARQEEIRNTLASLKLNGVMDGPVPLARIDGRTVRVGDTVADLFMVGQIHDRAVDLIADNQTYTISLSDGPGGPNGRGGLKSNNPMNPRR